MRKLDLLSGRVKKVIGVDLDSNRYDFLDLKNAEPDAGYPAQTGSLFTSTNTGTRSWLTTNSATSGLKIVGSALQVDEDTTFVDTTGFINTSANDLHTVLFDLDQNLSTITENALTVVVTDDTIDGNGITGSALSIGQGVRPTDDPYFAGLQVAPQDAVSVITLSNPIRVTVATAHDLTDGDLVTFRDVEGTTQINGVDYYVDVINSTTVDLYSDQALTTGIDGSGGYGSYTSGGFLIGGGYRFPTTDGTNGQVLTTDGAGNLSFTTPFSGIANVVEDTTPQLGGNLDVNGFAIIGPAANNVVTIDTDNLIVTGTLGTENDVINFAHIQTINLNNIAKILVGTAISSSTSTFNLSAFDATEIRSFKIVIQASNTTSGYYYTSELLCMHDGTNAYSTEYATLDTTPNEEMIVVTPVLSSGLFILKITPSTTDTIQYKVLVQQILA